jgi:aspartyl/glutamyl-tRNA(Asn/Gln) amidotransferase C subunit
LSRRRTQKAASLDRKQVERLAELSRLALSAREADQLREEFASILGYFATLDGVDVSNATVVNEARAGSGTREDIVRPSIPKELLEGVPQKKGRFVRAPRVF